MKLLGVTITKKYGSKHTQILVLYISILYSEINVSGQLQFFLQSIPGTQGENLKLHQCMRTKFRVLQDKTRGLWGHVPKIFQFESKALTFSMGNLK